MQFVDGEGKVLVSALTRWVMLDRETTRPARITAEIAAPFRSE
ncbi:acyl-ACP thioesterase domain-containing protein [Citromicrobium bathyomarinum]